MSRRYGNSVVAALALAMPILSFAIPAGAQNRAFLSTDLEASQAAYAFQVSAVTGGTVDKFRATFPAGALVPGVGLVSLVVGQRAIKGPIAVTTDPLNPNALVLDVPKTVKIKPGTSLVLEIKGLTNPPSGDYQVGIELIDKTGIVLETLAPVPLSITPLVAGSGSGWTDDGSVVRLASSVDSVGIGTQSPASALHVLSNSSFPPRVESRDGDVFGAGWDFYHGDTVKGYVGVAGPDAPLGANELLLFGQSGVRTSIWAGRTRAITILPEGRVGIGTDNPGAILGVKPANNGAAFIVRTTGGDSGLLVLGDGKVGIGKLSGPSTQHACYANTTPTLFSECSSAAEYVPTVDDGAGFAKAGDLVSLTPSVPNPYDDAHAPFAVTKSAKPCDDGLIGFIVAPELGADGKKVNDHYLPLAIYGYFPVKVTLESGAIKRGDPITSSSKSGFGMKATGACKIVGYALEDADEEGTIQVFAHLGEHAAPEVEQLRDRVATLERENIDLKEQARQVAAQVAAIRAEMQTMRSPDRD